MDESQVPLKTISETTRVKPRLLIFDDSVSQLSVYCAKLSEKYAVEGVLVSSHPVYDKSLKHGLASGDWSEAIKALYTKPEQYKAVNHVVTSQDELRALLQERPPADYVLSDYQMRKGDINGADVIDGADVMRIAHEELPNAPRAIHTGARFAVPRKVEDLDDEDKEERISWVNDMRRHDFKIFPKPYDEKDFNPAVIEAYFAASHGPTP